MTWETWRGRLLMYSASYSFLLYYSTSAAVWFETWQEKHDRKYQLFLENTNNAWDFQVQQYMAFFKLKNEIDL